MNAASVLQTLYHTLVGLFTGRKTHRMDSEDTPHVESVSERQYFISHIDDYGDCV